MAYVWDWLVGQWTSGPQTVRSVNVNGSRQKPQVAGAFVKPTEKSCDAEGAEPIKRAGQKACLEL